MAGILDTARFRAFIAWETGASIKDVQTMVMGGHGDQMVPVVSATTVGGVPLTELASKGRITKMVQRTRVGGGEIVNLLGTSAWYAPGAAAAEMVDAILLDEKRILPCTALLEGEYGIDGLYMGVPVKLGAAGIEEIVPLKLSAEEQQGAQSLGGCRPRRRRRPHPQVARRTTRGASAAPLAWNRVTTAGSSRTERSSSASGSQRSHQTCCASRRSQCGGGGTSNE